MGRFFCSECTFVSDIKHSLNRHVNSVHLHMRFSCTQCEKDFSRNNALKRHIRSIHQGIKVQRKVDSVQCNLCPLIGTQSSIKDHIQSVHLKVKHNCGVCNKKYSSKGSLRTQNTEC